MRTPRKTLPTATVDLSQLPRIINPAFLPLLTSTKRNLVMVGGAGSGKSVFAAQKFVYRAMTEPEGHHLIAFRKVGRTVMTSIFAQIESAIRQLGVMELWHPTYTAWTWEYRPNGNVIRCMGLDDVEKLKSIVGMSSTWLEEATEFNSADYEQINLRMRGDTPGYKQHMLTFNPISIYHWLKKQFFDIDQEGRTRTLKTTFLNNVFIDEDYKRELMALATRDPYMWQVYGLGDWGVVGNLVYGQFLMDPWPPRVVDGDVDEVFYGLDFGYKHPSALIEINMFDSEAYVDEVIYERHLTTPDLVDRMRQAGVHPKAPIYADAAEPKTIEELCAAGFNVLPADKEVLAGITLVKSVPVHSRPENVNVNAEASQYKWAETKDREPLDQPVKWEDHAMDALRYALFTHLRGRVEYDVMDVVKPSAGYGEVIPDLY